MTQKRTTKWDSYPKMGQLPQKWDSLIKIFFVFFEKQPNFTQFSTKFTQFSLKFNKIRVFLPPILKFSQKTPQFFAQFHLGEPQNQLSEFSSFEITGTTRSSLSNVGTTSPSLSTIDRVRWRFKSPPIRSLIAAYSQPTMKIILILK